MRGPPAGGRREIAARNRGTGRADGRRAGARHVRCPRRWWPSSWQYVSVVGREGNDGGRDWRRQNRRAHPPATGTTALSLNRDSRLDWTSILRSSRWHRAYIFNFDADQHGSCLEYCAIRLYLDRIRRAGAMHTQLNYYGNLVPATPLMSRGLATVLVLV